MEQKHGSHCYDLPDKASHFVQTQPQHCSLEPAGLAADLKAAAVTCSTFADWQQQLQLQPVAKACRYEQADQSNAKHGL